MTDREKSIIFITDLIESKLRKEREIEYYEEKLKEIEKKLFFLKKEQNVTETILDIIQNEKVLEFDQMKILCILICLSNLIVIDDELLRTRPTGGYRKENDE